MFALVVQGIEHLRPKEGVGRSNRSEGATFQTRHFGGPTWAPT